VASFLQERYQLLEGGRLVRVLISFREWLHSYKEMDIMDHKDLLDVLISFREWLHSYILLDKSV